MLSRRSKFQGLWEQFVKENGRLVSEELADASVAVYENKSAHWLLTTNRPVRIDVEFKVEYPAIPPRISITGTAAAEHPNLVETAPGSGKWTVKLCHCHRLPLPMLDDRVWASRDNLVNFKRCTFELVKGVLDLLDEPVPIECLNPT